MGFAGRALSTACSVSRRSEQPGGRTHVEEGCAVTAGGVTSLTGPASQGELSKLVWERELEIWKCLKQL